MEAGVNPGDPKQRQVDAPGLGVMHRTLAPLCNLWPPEAACGRSPDVVSSLGQVKAQTKQMLSKKTAWKDFLPKCMKQSVWDFSAEGNGRVSC